MTPDEAGTLCKAILASWPTQAAKVDRREFTIAYAMALGDLPYEQALGAVRDLAKLDEWIPSPAKIRALVVAQNHGERRSGVEAWGDVLREVARVGWSGSPTWSDPMVASAVGNIGWRAICMAPEGDAATRARFIEVYDSLAEREYRAAQLAPGAVSRLLPARSDASRLLGDLVQRILPAKTGEE